MLHVYDGKDFRREYNILNSFFHPRVLQVLKDLDVTVAGGALTSLFTNREVNDLDLYFRSHDSFERFCAYMSDGGLLKGDYDLTPDTNGFTPTKRAFRFFKELDEKGSFGAMKHVEDEEGEVDDWESCFDNDDDDTFDRKTYIRNIGMTDKSVMFSDSFNDAPVMQCIAFSTFKDSQEIFDKFDYTINMGAYNFKDEMWEFHRDFLKHNAQKVLVLNPGTDFPIISMLRASKYQTRGFTISRRETMKLGIAASKLKLESWEDAKAHLSGMYGTNVDELFNDKKPFSFERLFDKLDNAGDSFISKVATEKEKASASMYNLTSVTYFQQLQRIRRNSGRPYFDKLYGVMKAPQFYLMTPHKPQHKYTLGTVSTNEDVNFFHDIELFLTLEEAQEFLKSKATGQGWAKWKHSVTTADLCGSVIVVIEADNTDNILITSGHEISVKDQTKDVLKIVDFVESDGEIS